MRAARCPSQCEEDTHDEENDDAEQPDDAVHEGQPTIELASPAGLVPRVPDVREPDDGEGIQHYDADKFEVSF